MRHSVCPYKIGDVFEPHKASSYRLLKVYLPLTDQLYLLTVVFVVS